MSDSPIDIILVIVVGFFTVVGISKIFHSPYAVPLEIEAMDMACEGNGGAKKYEPHYLIRSKVYCNSGHTIDMPRLKKEQEYD